MQCCVRHHRVEHYELSATAIGALAVIAVSAALLVLAAMAPGLLGWSDAEAGAGGGRGAVRRTGALSFSFAAKSHHMELGSGLPHWGQQGRNPGPP